VYSPIQPSRLYEKIVEQIQALILQGDLNPGDQLPSERELAEQFGVSRTAVREAVKALRQTGLVEIQPGRGTFITDGSSGAMRNTLGFMVKAGQGDGLAHLVQVRDILEPEIAAISAEMATEEDIRSLQEAVDVMDGALEDADRFIEADLEFHLALARATQNSLIPILIDPIVDLLREQRARIFLVQGGAERGQYHHKRILKAIVNHDANSAREAMRAHLSQVRTDSDAASALKT
jgi:GntR family transcriptional repressor for pyruvate dehydrogenase complex